MRPRSNPGAPMRSLRPDARIRRSTQAHDPARRTAAGRVYTAPDRAAQRIPRKHIAGTGGPRASRRAPGPPLRYRSRIGLRRQNKKRDSVPQEDPSGEPLLSAYRPAFHARYTAAQTRLKNFRPKPDRPALTVRDENEIPGGWNLTRPGCVPVNHGGGTQ